MTTKHDLTETPRAIRAEPDALTGELTADQWKTSVLPGWDVKDTLAHILGTERMLEGGVDGIQDRMAQVVASAGADIERPHVRNPIGVTNEAWVEHHRSCSPDELLRQFRTTTAGRLAALKAMSDEDFASSSWTPAGQGTHASFMRIRIFDCWMHDQDIRYAVGRPGNDGGPAAEASPDEAVGALGFVAGKRGRAPQGSLVAFELTGPVKRTLYVEVTDWARVGTAISRDPDVSLRLESPLFMRLAGGGVPFDDVSDRVGIDGDLELGRRIAATPAFTVQETGRSSRFNGTTVSVLGGTGPQVRGRARRFAAAGLTVVLGSRSADRAAGTAAEPGPSARGATNAEAAAAGDLVIVAVPWDGHRELLVSLRDELAGKVVVDCVNPLGFDAQGAFARPVAEGSAAQQAAGVLPNSTVVAAFHHVSAVLLEDPAVTSVDTDVLVLGDVREATDLVQDLASLIPGVRGVYGGRLRNAHQVEALTANPISMNRRHKSHAGVRLTDV